MKTLFQSTKQSGTAPANLNRIDNNEYQNHEYFVCLLKYKFRVAVIVNIVIEFLFFFISLEY